MNTGAEYNADEIGVLKLKTRAENTSKYRRCWLYYFRHPKMPGEVKVGDTITTTINPSEAGSRDLKM